MPSLTRIVGCTVLLLVFVAVALAAQTWLSRETQRLRTELLTAKRAQLATALEVVPAADTDRWHKIEALLGARIRPVGGARPAGRSEASGLPPLEFDYALTPAGAVQVSFPLPGAVRLLIVQQRVTAIVLLLGLAVVLTATGLMLWRAGHSADAVSRQPWQTSRVEMGSLEHLAKTSVAQGRALDHERGVRRRAEEDAQLKHQMLAQSLDEKIRLGRDLHDGIIQSLYAIGLTLESARNLSRTDPAAADQRLGKCLDALNGTIRDVRAYITGLAPESLRSAGFGQAVDGLVAELGAGREVKFELRIDEDATALLTPEQSADALHVAREAISNAVRHGRATKITVRLHKSDREVCLLVQDNGAGFDPSQRPRGGHGLGNMRARAERLGAAVRVQSQPGAGARVILTVPVLQTT